MYTKLAVPIRHSRKVVNHFPRNAPGAGRWIKWKDRAKKKRIVGNKTRNRNLVKSFDASIFIFHVLSAHAQE